MTLAVLHLAVRIAPRLPAAWRVAFGAALGWIAGSMLRIRRSIVETSMERAGVSQPSRAARRMYRDLGHGLVELLWFAGASPRERAAAIDRVVIEDDAARALEAALTRGPVILFGSHTGNWELAAAAAATYLERHGKRLAVVAKAIHSRSVDSFVSRLRASFGIRIVAPHGALAGARRALAAGDVVVLPIDQVPDRARHGIPLSFLGQTAIVDRGPATLAWRVRATVLVVAAYRDDDQSHRLRVLDTILPPAAGTASRRWIDEVTRRSTADLEAFVRSKPTSWLWLHRRWRSPRRLRSKRTSLVVART